MKSNNKLSSRTNIVVFLVGVFVLSVIFFLLFSNYKPEFIVKLFGENYEKNNLLKMMFILFAGMILLLYCRCRNLHRKLGQQEERYKHILAAVDSAMYDYDIITRELTVSEGFVEMFGYSLPKDFFAQIPELSQRHPEFDCHALQEKFIAVEMNKRQDEINLLLRSDIRGLSQLQITMVPRINKDNQVVGIHGVISDITNTYTDNLNLKQDHRSALLIISSLAPLALSANLTKNTHHFIAYNRTELQCVWGELDKGSFDDLINRSLNHIYEADKEGFLAVFSRENLLRAFADGRHIVNYQYRIIDDNGGLLWYKGHCVMVHSEIDDCVHLAFVLTDNNEYMEQQRKLQRKYDLTIENMPAYTAKWIFKDGDMYLMDANQRYLDFMGGSAEELFNKSVVSGFDNKEKSQLLAKLYTSVVKRESISLTHSVITYDGKRRMLNIQASYFEEADGKPVYFGVLTDVTELVVIEERLKGIEDEKQINGESSSHTVLQYNFADKTAKILSGGDTRIDVERALSNCPESLIQSGVIELDNLEKTYGFFEDLHIGRNNISQSVTLCCKDGTKIFAEAAGSIIHNPTGEPTSAIIILTKTGEEAKESKPMQNDTSAENKRVIIKTFGSFDIFVDGTPVCFTNPKAKELLAILVDRAGGTLSSSEAISLLWEDEPAGEKQMSRYRKLAARLKETLEAVKCESILMNNNGIRSINAAEVECDYYNAVSGDENAIKQYQGFYMTGYSWAEERNVALNRMFGVDNSEN